MKSAPLASFLITMAIGLTPSLSPADAPPLQSLEQEILEQEEVHVVRLSLYLLVISQSAKLGAGLVDQAR